MLDAMTNITMFVGQQAFESLPVSFCRLSTQEHVLQLSSKPFPLLLQIIQWVAHHGSAAVELHAYFLIRLYDQPAGPRSWYHYQHGVNVLPALVPNLQHLTLVCEEHFMVAEQDLVGLQILTRLQTLHLIIASNGNWDLDTLSPLQHLTALEQLDMNIRGLETRPMLLAPEISRLTLLTALSLHRQCSGEEEVMYNSCNAGNVIGNLTRLQNLSATCLLDTIPDAFSRLQKLQTLSMGGADDDWSDFSAQPSIRSCKELTSLSLQNFIIAAGATWLNACCGLSCLPSLSHISLDHIDLEAVASNEWAFGTSLRSLSFEAGCLQGFPEALLSLTTLQCLDLYQVDLEDLSEFPTGPYLEHITSLDLCETKLPAFPEALVQASKLQKIEFFDDEPWLDIDRLRSILPQSCKLDIPRA